MTRQNSLNPRHLTRLAFGALALASLSGHGAAMAQQAAKPIAVTPPAGAPMSFADLIDRVSPAVVSVVVTTEVRSARAQGQFNPFRGLPGFEEYEDRFGEKDDEEEEGGSPEQDGEGRSLGSGFFISSEGHIVTNNHVVENAREVVVSLKDGQELAADVIGVDEQTDLAVLKVKKSGAYPFVAFATDAKPRVGDWVVAVGNPFGLGGTATAGIVSADGRELAGGAYNDFIQIDAPINRGNSGGPTFNLQGQVIGVNTAIFSDTGGGSVGIGFAIEAAAAKRIADALIRDGKVIRGWLGVEIQSISPLFADALNLKTDKGAIVSRVVRGGPAEAGGLRREDIIIAVNGEAVKDNRDLTRRVGSLLAGSRNAFRVIRDGKEITLEVTVRERNEAMLREPLNPARANMEPPKAGPQDVAVEGGTMRPLGADEAGRFDLAAPGTGLLVVTVEPKALLDGAGIVPGDAILTVNSRPVRSPAEFTATLAEARAKAKDTVLVSVGCGQQERCGDTTTIRPLDLKAK